MKKKLEWAERGEPEGIPQGHGWTRRRTTNVARRRRRRRGGATATADGDGDGDGGEIEEEEVEEEEPLRCVICLGQRRMRTT